MKKLRILNIGRDDLAAIVQIAQESGLSSWSGNDYMDEISRDDSIMLRLETDTGETIGFLVGRRVISSSAEDEFDAEIYNIAVKRGFRGHGGGTALLQKFLDHARRKAVQNVWLDVRRSNEVAIRFYEKNGFSLYSIRKNFYSHPSEDGMVMRLGLYSARLIARAFPTRNQP